MCTKSMHLPFRRYRRHGSKRGSAGLRLSETASLKGQLVKIKFMTIERKWPAHSLPVPAYKLSTPAVSALRVAFVSSRYALSPGVAHRCCAKSRLPCFSSCGHHWHCVWQFALPDTSTVSLSCLSRVLLPLNFVSLNFSQQVHLNGPYLWLHQAPVHNLSLTPLPLPSAGTRSQPMPDSFNLGHLPDPWSPGAAATECLPCLCLLVPRRVWTTLCH